MKQSSEVTSLSSKCLLVADPKAVRLLFSTVLWNGSVVFNFSVPAFNSNKTVRGEDAIELQPDRWLNKNTQLRRHIRLSFLCTPL